MATLVLLNYNNYYNRIIKKELTLEAYRRYQLGQDIPGVNFIPGDYVNTSQVINWSNSADPNYLLVLDSNGNISSRWYIVETSRIRKGQLQLQLHRDLIVDYYNEVITAPCYIEKATISNINDPAIFNNEDMSFNQIKQAEYQLRDKSQVAWIVGYVPRNSFNGTEAERTITTSTSYSGAQSITVDKLSSYEYFDYTTQEFISDARNITYRINTYVGGPSIWDDMTISMNSAGRYAGISGIIRRGTGSYTGNRTYRYVGSDLDREVKPDGNDIITIDGAGLFANFTPTIMRQMNALVPDYLNVSTSLAYDSFMSENGKVIFNQEDNQYYAVRINRIGEFNIELASLPVNSGLYNLLYNSINQARFTGTPNTETFQVRAEAYRYKLSLELLSTEVTTTIAQPSGRYHLSDSPYDMFCIPYPIAGENPLPIYKNGSVYISEVNRDASFDIAISVASSSGQGNIYDVQLLPYCPIQSIIKEDGQIDIGDTLNSPITIKVGNTTQVVSVLLWAIQSEFKLRIPFSVPESASVLAKKVKNETEFYRLCSPNYSGLFEFSAEKNGGVSYVDVDCNYKPFSPYIHVAINFNDLYGQSFGDSRGLICGGDFSLPQVTNAWADYQLNNKNYQQMFDRQVQSMEVNNAVQREREIWNAASSALGAGVSGAAAGMMAGGPVGALAGIGTAALSAAGGLRDIQLNEKLRTEALDYKRDMFGYQLGNIKALPQGLAKVSAFTANNKIFPFVEKYSCTDIEKQALINKLRYNGMTIMRVGTIAEFKQQEESYIKGRLIRLESISEDFHLVNAIAEEIYKGVFIK